MGEAKRSMKRGSKTRKDERRKKDVEEKQINT